MTNGEIRVGVGSFHIMSRRGIMRRGTPWLAWTFAAALLAGLANPCLADDAKCTLARKIAEEGTKRFKTDKKEGLRLLIKAQSECPEDPVLNYNLGLAYYRSGHLKESEEHLSKAAGSRRDDAECLNLLSWVMLENGSDKAKALEYSVRAAKLKPKSPSIQDTYLRALQENGRFEEAARECRKAKEKWPKDAIIGARYGATIDAYIAENLKMMESGKQDAALAGLKRLDFDPNVTNAYCWALHSAGRTEQALTEAQAARDRFKGEEALAQTFDQIMERFILACYQRFKQGKRAEAVEAVDKMRSLYAGHSGVREAYEKMFKAVLDEASTIQVPEPVKIAQPKGAVTGEGGSLLEKLQGGALEREDTDLVVDVDRDIPKGKSVKKNAVAVIIGNRHYSGYRHGIPDVDYAERDAKYIREYVINVLGYSAQNVIYESNTTFAKLAQIFGSAGEHKGMLHNWVKPKESEVFIYYTGHGAPDAGGKGAFLVPVDAHVDYISSNGYSLETFYENLAKLPAKRIIVVLDACFSGDSARGMLVKNMSPAVLKSVSPVKKLPNVVTFASADREQVSTWFPEKRHSLFTYFFMKGLKGDADSNRDRKITVREIRDYIAENVPYQARRLVNREQTPIVEGDESWEMAVLR